MIDNDLEPLQVGPDLEPICEVEDEEVVGECEANGGGDVAAVFLETEFDAGAEVGGCDEVPGVEVVAELEVVGKDESAGFFFGAADLDDADFVDVGAELLVRAEFDAVVEVIEEAFEVEVGFEVFFGGEMFPEGDDLAVPFQYGLLLAEELVVNGVDAGLGNA